MARGNVVDDSHYTAGEVQPIDLIESQDLPFREGSIVKYVTRWRKKGGLRDLYAARWMLARLIASEENQAWNELEQAMGPNRGQASCNSAAVGRQTPAHHIPLEEGGSFIVGPGNLGLAEFVDQPI